MNPAITSAPARELTEAELVDEFLQIQSEEELDHFLPFLLPALKIAGPLIGKVAGPLLKGVAGSLLGGGGGSSSSPRRRPRRTNRELEEEQFLGKILGGLFGEAEAESEEEEQFLGKILGGLFGETELEGEDEDEQYFIGKLLGGLFGRRKNRELEDQFIGGLLGKLFGRELELESEDEAEAFARRAQRFIRLARVASREAARELSARIRSGQRPSESLVQQLVLRAFVRTANRIGGGPAPVTREIAAPGARAAAQGNARWVRRGNSLVFTL